MKFENLEVAGFSFALTCKISFNVSIFKIHGSFFNTIYEGVTTNTQKLVALSAPSPAVQIRL